jgi:hypothetical protein
MGGRASRRLPPRTVVRERAEGFQVTEVLTNVRSGRRRLARLDVVSVCESTAYDAVATHDTLGGCQNGIDCKLYAFGRTVPADNRMPLLVVWRHPGVDSTPPVIDSTPPVVDSRLHFGELSAFMSPRETSYRRPEASGRRLEVLFYCLQARGCQSRVVNCEMCSLQSPTGGFRSLAQTVQSITRTDHLPARSARLTRRRVLASTLARAPPKWRLLDHGGGFSRPSLTARFMVAEWSSSKCSNRKGEQDGKVSEKRS